jgi:LPXTG-site transpeptidase (sortase) family protein
MQHYRWTIMIMAFLLAACGAQTPTQQSTAPTTAPSSPVSAPAATALPTTATSAAPVAATSAAPSAVPSAIAEPTAPLILEPTTPPPAGAANTAEPTPFFRAKPTAVVQAQPKPAPKAATGPSRLVIKDIGVDYRPVSVGLDKNRVPIVPDHDVGWYNLSSGPGQGENIVLWGHVLRFRQAPKTPAPFAHLKELKPGASVVLYDRGGEPHTYTITKQIWVTPDQVEFILPQGKEMITMVSCIGDKVIQDGEVVDESHRLLTIAEPA